MKIFLSKMVFLSENTSFAVKNDGPYLPRITRDTFTAFDNNGVQAMPGSIPVLIQAALVIRHFSIRGSDFSRTQNPRITSNFSLN
jgi:hypothetical protein